MSAGGSRDLRGATVVVTGASSGIGAAAARGFAALGARVAVVGRSPERTVEVARQVGGRAHVVDFGRLDDVRRLADDLLDGYERIDVLANNAGAMYASRRTSADGHELTFQVNHLAPFLLTGLLLDRLTQAPDGPRVIMTGSADYRNGRLDLDDLDHVRGRYRSRSVYAASKLATVLFTRELARRTRGRGVSAVAFHPGVVATDVVRDNALYRAAMGSWVARRLLATPEQGAEPLLQLATRSLDGLDGAYFDRLTRQDLKPGQATDPDLAARLWERSEQLTGLPARGSAAD